jgi:GNAT superfamily N-acetyltransferase
MSDPSALRVAMAQIVAETFSAATPAARDALVEEHTDALIGAGTRRWFVALDEEGAGVVVEGSMVARAWVLGITRASDRATALLADLERQARALGEETKIRIGGPPGSYLRSGTDARDRDALAWFLSDGYVEEKRHVDLDATLLAPASSDPRVRRADRSEREALLAWMTDRFAPAWRAEVERALVRHDAVFVAGAPSAYEGFAAHSGNNAALGTFGPVGVDERARRGGLGAALSRAVLDDLARRGFHRATIPWVDPSLVAFYQRLTERVDVIERVVLAKTLRTPPV